MKHQKSHATSKNCIKCAKAAMIGKTPSSTSPFREYTETSFAREHWKSGPCIWATCFRQTVLGGVIQSGFCFLTKGGSCGRLTLLRKWGVTQRHDRFIMKLWTIMGFQGIAALRHTIFRPLQICNPTLSLSDFSASFLRQNRAEKITRNGGYPNCSRKSCDAQTYDVAPSCHLVEQTWKWKSLQRN